jgi:hypothetical protein
VAWGKIARHGIEAFDPDGRNTTALRYDPSAQFALWARGAAGVRRGHTFQLLWYYCNDLNIFSLLHTMGRIPSFARQEQEGVTNGFDASLCAT